MSLIYRFEKNNQNHGKQRRTKQIHRIDSNFEQVQAFGMDITKEEGGQIKIAPHESATSTPQSSIEETGESTPEEATGEESARAEGGGDMESPVSLADLLG